jgi:uncharacterized protein DUF3105
VSKKLQEKQRRRLAEEKKKQEQRRAQRRRNLITIVVAIIVTVGVVWLILDESTTGPKKGDGNIDAPFGVSEEKAACEDVESAEPQKADHIELNADHPAYNTNPPTSGAHYAAPLAPIDTGFYTNEIEPEKVLHNLEHGMIAIWYNPDAPDEVKQAVEDAVAEVPDATLAVPWDDIDSPNQIVITAWSKLQRCEDVSKDVLDDFRVLYQGKGPENVGIPTFEKP